MDTVKTGKYIASLRRRAGLTQELLGEKLGVTNKTISRWENGNYMPDIDMFALLAKEFGVSVNDLIAGETGAASVARRATEAAATAGTTATTAAAATAATADKSMAAPAKSDSFSLEERKAYFKKKWRKEHAALLVLLGLIQVAACVVPFGIGKPWVLGFAPLIGMVAYCYQHNRMMAYVENRLYD